MVPRRLGLRIRRGPLCMFCLMICFFPHKTDECKTPRGGRAAKLFSSRAVACDGSSNPARAAHSTNLRRKALFDHRSGEPIVQTIPTCSWWWPARAGTRPVASRRLALCHTLPSAPRVPHHQVPSGSRRCSTASLRIFAFVLAALSEATVVLWLRRSYQPSV